MAMKFRAHETFYIRKGWISKGMKNVALDGSVFVNKEINPMDVLGIGSNMVKSMRYWLQVVGLTSEPKSGKRNQTFTDLGELVYAKDRYIEEIGTLCLLQYKMATCKDDATAWYFFFNEFGMSEFTKEDFTEAIQKYIKMDAEVTEVAARSLQEDFQCIVNTYVPRYKSNPGKVSPENNIDCPFGELGLIDIVNKSKKIYKKSTIPTSLMNPFIILAIIADNSNGRREIPLNELLVAPGNIGKVFNLTSIEMLDILYKLERMGKLKINRTAGLDVVLLADDYTFIDCVKNYYESLDDVE